MRNNILRKGLVFIVIALFTLTSIIPSIVGEGEAYFYATQDIPVSNGGIVNDYTATTSSDNSYEGIKEMETKGKPSNRYSYLEHKWRFELTGSYTSVDFYLEAYHTVNSEGDDFIFAYSTNDANYYDLVTVTKTSDDDNYQSASMPNTLTGTVYIRVVDLDRTQGRKVLDTIYIDHMYIEGTSGPDTTPPVISDVASSVSDSIWYNMSPSVDDPNFYPRERFAMTYDSNAQRLIVFGGMNQTGWFLNDTWVYNFTDNTWYNMMPDIFGGTLYYREDHAIVYDAHADKTILFGGDKVSKLNDTWAYNFSNNTWVKRNPTYVNGELDARDGHQMVYDSAAQCIIMYGGGSTVYENETWKYDYNANTWTNLSPGTVHGNLDKGKMSFGMAYDSKAGRTIMACGSESGSTYTNETWVYNYSVNKWYKMSPGFVGGTLTPRSYLMGDHMVYDSSGDRCILFGGMKIGGDQLNDTWFYNFTDNTWYKAIYNVIGGEFPGREAGALAYDSVNRRTFLFGGFNQTDPFMSNETWAYIGELTAPITWTTDEPSDSVVNYGNTTALGLTVSDSALVTEHKIVLTDVLPDTTYYYEVESTDEASNTATDDNGGSYYSFTTFLGPEISNVDSSVSDDTWIKMNPNEVGGAIGERERFAMVYDSTNDRTIAFGGYRTEDGKRYNDTWLYNYNNNTWYNANPGYQGGTLYPRRDFSMAYDSVNDRTVLFGGFDVAAPYFNDTWLYNYSDNTWYNMSPDYKYGTLTKRVGHAMTYDSDAQRVILFGGWDGSFLNDTWVYNFSDNTWYNMSPSDIGGSLPAVAGTRIAYDSVNKVTVMAGGAISGSQDYNDETWTYNYNNNSWVKRDPSFVGGTLIGRHVHTLAYDANAGHVVLFGGQNSGNQLDDTWIYIVSDDTWIKINPSVAGGILYTREAPEMVYDSSADKIILFGGWTQVDNLHTLNDTWVLNTNDYTATITWTTDEPSDSVVNYGTTTALGNTTSDSSFVTNHQIVLTDLIPDTTYFYEVQSTDEASNTATDDNGGSYYNFTTFLGPEISSVDSTVNDNTWYNMSPETVGGTLYERELHAMVYDSSAQRTIMFGGGGAALYNDTWVYNFSDNKWYNMSPGTVGGTSTGRIWHAMCYDSDADRTILFGGYEDGNYRKDTWAYNFNTNTWTNLTALPTYSEVGGTLSPRSWMKMVYDSSTQRTIMFGGSKYYSYNDTWAYDYSENKWYNMSPETVGGTLNATWVYGMAYDSSADRTIMFGGCQEEDIWTNDTWVYNYNDNKWFKMNPEIVGGNLWSRTCPVMVYDSSAQRTIMFGGQKDGGSVQLNDTWVYNYSDNKWCKASYSIVSGTLYGREMAGMVYDSDSKRTILFAGWSNDYPGYELNDTWMFKINDPTAKITWITDEPSDSVVNYGTTTALGNTSSDSTLVTNHRTILTDLLPDKTYYYEIQSTDGFGNTATDDNNGEYYTFSTVPDTTPPVITNVATSGITHNSATVTWNTDEPSNTVVHYGDTTDLGSTKQKSSLVTSHSITLTDLQPETTYYYEVQSTDIKGNTAIDNNSGTYYTFTTEQAPSNVMHVYSIDMWYEPVKNRNSIYTKVKIVDASDNAVEGATVYLETTLPNGDTISADDITDSTGFVTFIYGPTPKTGTYTSSVINVAKDGWTYNPDENVETSESIYVS